MRHLIIYHLAYTLKKKLKKCVKSSAIEKCKLTTLANNTHKWSSTIESQYKF